MLSIVDFESSLKFKKNNVLVQPAFVIKRLLWLSMGPSLIKSRELEGSVKLWPILSMYISWSKK